MQWDLLTSSPGDTRASPSVTPASDEARTMTATSGRNLLDLYASSGLVGPLARMLLVTSRWGSTLCLLTWKDLATPGKRLLFRLLPWTQDTDETAFGLWPTVTASMANYDESPETFTERGMMLKAEGRGPRGKLHYPLGMAVRMWPTPNARDWKDNGPLADPSSHQITLGRSVPGKLNPQWVEWLMGYPIEWTALEPLAMQSSRKLRKKSSAP
jgi:hypothetical protein